MYRCHYCGNLETEGGEESYFNCNSPHGELCGGCENLRLLNKQILDAKAVLEDLLNQRRELKSKLNHQHNSMTHRLPVEIVSIIFEFYVALVARISNTRGALVLGAVCRTWRQIAWSLPQLWTHLNIYFGPSIKETHIQLATEWLGRSGRLPLSISLGFEIESKPNGLPHELLFKVVKNYSSRCYSLFLADCHSPPSQFLSLRKWSHLDYLVIKSKPTPELEMTAATSGFYPHFDGSNLIDFTASSIFLHEFFDIIQQVPQLTKCNLGTLFNRYNDFPLPIVHSRIKSIDIGFYDESLELFLDSMTLPSLTDLSMRVFSEELPTQAFVSFFTRSSCHLQDLSIDDARVADEELVRILRATPSLTTLRLSSLITGSDIPLVPFYHALSAHLPTTDNRSEQAYTVPEPFLPFLKEFTFSGELHIPWKLVPNLFAPLTGTPDTPRRPLTTVSINCDLSEDDPTLCYLSKETISQLQNFIDEGVDITVQVRYDGIFEDFIQLSIKWLGESEEN